MMMQGDDDVKCRSYNNQQDQIYYEPSGLIEYVLFKSLVFVLNISSSVYKVLVSFLLCDLRSWYS